MIARSTAAIVNLESGVDARVKSSTHTRSNGSHECMLFGSAH
jgi:hypothetical protein